MSDTPKDWLDRVCQSKALDELEASCDGPLGAAVTVHG